jgi:hypothetical protein
MSGELTLVPADREGEGGSVALREALEARYGSAAAGALIYAASSPENPIPGFYSSEVDALADMRARAAAQRSA